MLTLMLTLGWAIAAFLFGFLLGIGLVAATTEEKKK